MIYLKLFLNFLMIGALSFGGGYGMVSLVRETVISNGWLTESEFLNFIAVSESTPGPLAVNMATFIGSTQGGILGRPPLRYCNDSCHGNRYGHINIAWFYGYLFGACSGS